MLVCTCDCGCGCKYVCTALLHRMYVHVFFREWESKVVQNTSSLRNRVISIVCWGVHVELGDTCFVLKYVDV